MATKLTDQLVELLNDAETTKVLATLDDNGFPHAVVKQSIQAAEDGTIVYLELLESSRTNKNLVRSIWYDQKVAISLSGKDGRSFQVKGIPIKTHITGELFARHYAEAREKLGDVDLAAVWVIEPQEVIEETFSVRQAAEEAKHPYFNHLDRLAR